MKKILTVITFLAFFLLVNSKVEAAVIEFTTPNPDVKVYLKNSLGTTIKSIEIINNKSTNELLYSIEPMKNIGRSYTKKDYSYYQSALSYDLRERVGKIMLYGYGYANRTDLNWYMATQYLVWEEIIRSTEGEIYFVDDNNNKIDLYLTEREAILEDIRKHNDFPSFLEKDLMEIIKVTDTLVYEDTKKILDNYEIEIDPNLYDYNITSDKLVIKPLKPSNTNIFISRKSPVLSDYAALYFDGVNAELMGRGNISKERRTINVYTKNPTLTISKKKINNLSNEGSVYQVFFENGNMFYSNVVLNKDGLSEELVLEPGKYYILEKEVTYGHELNKEKIYFEIEKDLTIEIENHLILKDVKFQIQDRREQNISNLKLDIFQNGEIINSLSADDLGSADVKLAYGTYEVGCSNKECSPKEFLVDENFNDGTIISLDYNLTTNNQEPTIEVPEEIKPSEKVPVTSKLIVKKVDYITNEVISDVIVELYNANKELLQTCISDKEGLVNFTDLEIGSYYVKEKDSTEYIALTLKENIDTYITLTNKNENSNISKVEIAVPDTIASDYSIIINFLIMDLGVMIKKMTKKYDF